MSMMSGNIILWLDISIMNVKCNAMIQREKSLLGGLAPLRPDCLARIIVVINVAKTVVRHTIKPFTLVFVNFA